MSSALIAQPELVEALANAISQIVSTISQPQSCTALALVVALVLLFQTGGQRGKK